MASRRAATATSTTGASCGSACPAMIRGVVVDTAFFRGNYPDTCALCGGDDRRSARSARARRPRRGSRSCRARRSRATRKNAFAIEHARSGSRTCGSTSIPTAASRGCACTARSCRGWARCAGGSIDLAALEHGAVVETCSDMFFGSRNNLIKPGPSLSMADGWETRRRRGPGHEWAIVRLAGAGHDRAARDRHVALQGQRAGADAPSRARTRRRRGARCSRRRCSRTRATCSRASCAASATSRTCGLSVYPCGGVARLRAWGTLAPRDRAALARSTR